MSIDYDIIITDSMLRVKAVGIDDDLDEVVRYGNAVIDAVNESKVKFVLCDETELVYSLSIFETFQSAKFISENAPKVEKVAIVISPKNTNDATLWENVAVNRGLKVQFFLSVNEAEKFLLG